MKKTPLNFCIGHLPEIQQSVLKKILDLITAGKKLHLSDMGLLGYTFSRSRHKETAEFYHISVRQLYKWVENGCPRNDDETYDLFAVHEWLLKDVIKNEANLKDQKTEQEIRKLEIMNAKLEEKYIERTELENILTARATSLRNYFERSLSMNRAQRSMKSIDELVVQDYNFIKEMMDAYVGK